MSNIQVTHDTNLNNARSESSVVVNPNNAMQIVAGSKRFKNYHNYDFTLATAYSTDGGKSWNDSADLPMPGFTLLTDPAMAWDDTGNVFLVGLNGKNPPTFDAIGIVIYKSSDGGKTWSAPKQIHKSIDDDKQWAAGDGNPGSKFLGHVYAAWDDGNPGVADMRFARTRDHGATWIGTGVDPAGSVIASHSFSPEVNLAADGTVYIVYLAGSALDEIKMVVSTDGGNSFDPPTSAAKGIKPVSSSFLPVVHGWPVFKGANFRLSTVPTACVFGKTVAVTWADYRETSGRIYYALSSDGGKTWETGPSGRPLLMGPLPSDFQHFQPQIIAAHNGVIGCAFYEFGPKPVIPLIDVIMARSFDGGKTFSYFTVTDKPWDPSLDAPWSHHADGTPIDSSLTFIGEYFGLDASTRVFYPLWTDTRTGFQELWTAIVPVTHFALAAYATQFNRQQHVNYIAVVVTAVGTAFHIDELVLTPGAWLPNDLNKKAGALAPDFLPVPGSPIVGYTTTFNQQQHVIYIGPFQGDNHVQELVFAPGGSWMHNDLSGKAAPDAVKPLNLPAPGSPLDGYVTDFNQQQHVNYIGVDNHVHELVFAPGPGWLHNDLSNAAGAPALAALPAPGSPLDGYVTDFNQQQHVNYIGVDNHVHELVFAPGPGWLHNDLSNAAGAPALAALPAPGSPLDGYVTDFNQQQHVNYIGVDNHVHELVFAPGGSWTHNDLSKAAPDAVKPLNLPAPRSPLVGYATNFNQQQHVNYIGVDNHVHELVFVPGRGWLHNDLSNAAGAPALAALPAPGSPLVGYPTDFNQQQHVHYIGPVKGKNHVHQLVFAPGRTWLYNDLTAFALGAPDVAET